MGRAKKKPDRRKAPLGQGRSARSERKKRRKGQQELQAQLGQLHQRKKKKLQEAGVDTSKSTGFTKALQSPAKVQDLPQIERCFWPEQPVEPDDALKQRRKALQIKVQQGKAPAPVEAFTDPRLPPAFGLFFRGIRGSKLKRPTPIQMQTWPAALCGLDVLGIAPTGSGKTLAYLLPAAVHVSGQKCQKQTLSPVALILLPTRELALQVSDQFKGKGSLRETLKLRAQAIYGGVGKEEQLDSILTSGCPEVVAATPGRLLDLFGLEALSLESVSFLVLDEADKMLQLGFEQQLDAVAKAVRADRQCLLFSATFPLRLREAADRWLTHRQKAVIRVGELEVEAPAAARDSPSLDEPAVASRDTLTLSKSIEQVVHVCDEKKKYRKLIRFLDKIRQEEKDHGVRQRALVIIFCNKITTTKSVAAFLGKHGHYCGMVHSGVPQAKREKALSDFKAGRFQVLVATDVAGRGVHVKHLRYVVNFDFPSNLEQYCHRIGRTGRDGEQGTAFSFFTRNLAPLARDLVKLLEGNDQKVDPNLRSLTEGELQSEAQAAEPEDDSDATVPASSGGIRITPRKRKSDECADDSDAAEGLN